MVKAFLFDYGGVVSEGGGVGNILATRLAANIGISLEVADDILHVPEFAELMCGNVEEAHFWSSVERKYGTPIPEDARHIWNEWQDMLPLPHMQDLIIRLRSRGLIVGLLSNTIPATAHSISAHGGYDMFDFTVISCEVGSMKPEKAIYEKALEHMPGIATEEVIFLDDQERCLLPARELGLGTIHVTSTRQAILDVEQLLDA